MKTILVDAVHTFIIKGEGVFEDMHRLLERYPNKKIIVTNANDEQINEFGMNTLPYELFTLKHEPEKTSPEYYEQLLKKFNLETKDVIYFEHNQEAVNSAKSLGIQTYHYNKETKDLEALKEFLDEQLH